MTLPGHWQRRPGYYIRELPPDHFACAWLMSPDGTWGWEIQDERIAFDARTERSASILADGTANSLEAAITDADAAIARLAVDPTADL